MAAAAAAFAPFTASSRPCRRSSSALRSNTSRQAAASRQRAAAQPEHFVERSSAAVSEVSSTSQPIADLAAACCTPQPAAETAAGGVGPLTPATAALLVAGALAAGYGLKRVFDTPSRAYDENVGDEYDAWTEEGVLEYYWGEHIHLGFYTEEERTAGYKKKDFIQAKYDFVEEMLRWSGVQSPGKVLDVGCGIGGTSRYLANKFPEAQVTGITLSPKQVARGTQLAADRGLGNAQFKVMNALQMDFPDNTFDLVWACESGEHMPDKKAYVDEMVRVLKPGGTIVIATWCQRDETPAKPFSESDKERLQFLYDEWAHPFFVSKEEYGRIMQGGGKLGSVTLSDWTAPTIDSWRHSVWVGVWDPWIVVFKGPRIWYKTVREIVTLERMHSAFADGLMEYGMMKAVKKPVELVAAGAGSSSAAAAESVRIEVAP